MRKKSLEKISCPECNSNEFHLTKKNENKTEIREGIIECKGCRKKFSIKNGIIDLLLNPSKSIVNEQKGWMHDHKKNFESVRRNEFILSLPRPQNPEDKEWWEEQATNYEFVFEKMKLSGKESVLDLGAGRCWSTRDFAKKGCEAIALDIVREKYVGLESSDLYITKDLFFERILGDMNEIPFMDESFDIVFSTATLHHSSNLMETFKEIRRVLKPNGRIVLVNEPVRGILESKEFKHELVDLGVNEHKYTLFEWINALKKNGFKVKIFFPKNVEEMMKTGNVKGEKKYKLVIGRIVSVFWRFAPTRVILERVLHLPGQVFIGMGLIAIGE
ncbi:methyltransferase domain-containing protein, partial [Candidatus Micrarchaeota archaeon]|nr:methyltransferase domain-containing protein [Candidatus Micrarchaeota archaeon]